MHETTYTPIRTIAVGLVAALSLLLASCSSAEFALKDVMANLGMTTVTMSTYDAQGHPVDTITGNSFSIKRDTRFDSVSSDGYSNSDSSVLSITIGGGEVSHVGSAMIVAEDGLSEAMGEFPDKVDIAADDRSVPFLDRFLNDVHNQWAPRSKVVLIRSQQGHPIAVFTGDSVATGSSDIPKSTSLLIDGKLLILYRVDYTIYDTALLGGSATNAAATNL